MGGVAVLYDEKGLSEDAYQSMILAAARRGSFTEQEYTVMYEHEKRYVHNVVSKVLSGNSDADDVSQKVFMNVLFNISQFRGDAKFRTWLHTISYNQALNHIRVNDRRTDGPKRSVRLESLVSPGNDESPIEYEVRSPFCEQSTPEDDFIREEDNLRVIDLICSGDSYAADELKGMIMRGEKDYKRVQEILDDPKWKATILVMVYCFGESYSDCAAYLGIKEGSLKSRIHRAKETFLSRSRKRGVKSLHYAAENPPSHVDKIVPRQDIQWQSIADISFSDWCSLLCSYDEDKAKELKGIIEDEDRDYVGLRHALDNDLDKMILVSVHGLGVSYEVCANFFEMGVDEARARLRRAKEDIEYLIDFIIATS